MGNLTSFRPLAFVLGLAANLVVASPADAQAPANARPVQIEGELEVIHIDDAERGRSSLAYFVRESGSDDVFELKFEGRAPSTLRTGREVQVSGRALGRRLWVSDLSEGGESSAATGEDLAAVDERNAVVLVVNLLNKSASASVATATQHMFTGNPSAAQVFDQTSYSQIQFPADTDGDLAPDVFGPYTVNYNTSPCDYYAWAQAADSAATADGVDLSLYRHRVYIMPPSCGYRGVANLGCGSYCRAWIMSGGLGPVYAHEVGHNVNAHHATSDPENDGVINNEYGDYSDPEGSSNGGWRGYNAPHKDQFGIYDSYPGSISTVVANGVYDIYPLAIDPANAGGPQILKIGKPDTNEVYYLSYRIRIGIDAALNAGYIDGTSVHRYRGSGANKTYFIDLLSDGEQFNDSVNGINVTQIGRAADDSYVTVSVDFDISCASNMPSVSLSPSVQVFGGSGSSEHTLSVTNNDGVGCGDTTFDLADVADAGLSTSLSANVATLSPGETATATLQITANTGEGAYLASVEAVDNDGLEPSHSGVASADVNVTVDTSAPWPPTGLNATVAGGSGDAIDLAWEVADDGNGSGIDIYLVFRKGGASSGYVEIDQTGSTSYRDSALAFETTYEYKLRAVDGVGNESGDSDMASATTKAKTKTKGKGGGGGGGGG